MADPSSPRVFETAVKILKEIQDKKAPNAYNAFRSSMAAAGLKLSAPDAASLYARAGVVIREKEKQAKQAPAFQLTEGASSSKAALPEASPQAGDEEDGGGEGPIQHEEDQEDQENPEENEPQFMPFLEAKECFFFPYQDEETLEEFETRVAQGVTVVQPDEQEEAIECSLNVFEEAHAYIACRKANLLPVRIRHKLVLFAPHPLELPEVSARRYCALASAYSRIAGPGGPRGARESRGE